eukprot:3968136-Pleurochrysis_carterae.AAC.3
MDDSDVDMSDSEYQDSDVDDNTWVESAPVRQPPPAYLVLDEAECLSTAEAQVRQVSEMLCVEPDVAAILLRQFRWDRERMTTGA